jgi:hypothetical protein
MLHDLQQGIFTELNTNKPVNQYRRDLQKTYVEGIIILLDRRMADPDSDELSIIKAQAKSLSIQINKAGKNAPNSISRAHFADLYERLNLALHPKS